MRDTDLMQLALGLIPPWMVKACTFDAEARRLDIEIDFARGGRFPCPHCAKADCPVARPCTSTSLSPISSGLWYRHCSSGQCRIVEAKTQSDRRAYQQRWCCGPVCRPR